MLRSGLFLFDIYCDEEYPAKPPKLRLRTTGAGSVRFNPNLYANGYVCLSLINTWSAPVPEMRWQPEKSTLLQVLVSIQGLVLVKLPFYCEPGFDSYAGTAEGKRRERESENGGYQRIRENTLKWAIIDQIEHPPRGFEDTVRKHFKMKRDYIVRIATQWVQEAEEHEAEAHATTLRQLLQRFEVMDSST